MNNTEAHKTQKQTGTQSVQSENPEKSVIQTMRRYSEYKDSGIEWVGQIPRRWNVKPLFSIAKLVSTSECEDKELLSVYLDKGVIKFSDVNEKRTNATSEDLSKYQLVKPGNLVLNNQQAWRGSVGVSKFEGIVSPAYIVLALSNEIDPIYANYIFRDPSMVSYYLISSKGVGTIQRNLYWPQLKRASIWIPPLPEQTAIAAFLDRKTALIDKAIAIKQKQIELLKERRQILIQRAVTRGLNPNAKLKDSGVEWIGEIPEGWEVIHLRRLFKFLNTKRVPLSGEEREKMQGEYPYYGASGIIDYVNDYLFDDTLILIAEDGANLLSKSTPLAFIAQGKYWVNNHAHILKPMLPGFEFWSELLSSVDYTIYISGAAQPKLTMDRLASVKLPVPPKEQIINICEYILNISDKIYSTLNIKKQEIEKLKEYKATLINEVVTGKVKVC
ncbi:MAG: restriction endonuclease subunit S [Bacteroidetes bacterium]|nr:restriction endonuclease subunit S [Bacteroidota bacterium]